MPSSPRCRNRRREAADRRLLLPRAAVLELDVEVLRTGAAWRGYTYDQNTHLHRPQQLRVDRNEQRHARDEVTRAAHVRTIGTPGVNKGSNDPDHPGGLANFYGSPRPTSFIADGYITKRVVVRRRHRRYKRHWAFTAKSNDTRSISGAGERTAAADSTLHGLVGSKDGLIYVSDRRGNRIQVFRQNGEFLMEKFVRPETGGSGSGFSLQFSRDPEQSILYLMDGTNQRVWMLRRKDLAILDRFGKPGRQAGEFIRAHMIAIDSKNRMYTGEAGNGRRMQRWILKGTRPAASVTPPKQ
jgi:hypothetical protein